MIPNAHIEYAFPSTYRSLTDDQQVVRYGLTLRDYFAAKAMQAFIASPLLKTDTGEYAVAANAYKVADAMLEVRK